jgi:peptidoglycan-N-acetylglucosamine deacetylase
MIGGLGQMLTESFRSLAEQPRGRRIAVTIDDLPVAPDTMAADAIIEMTTTLLTALRDEKVPVVGFVNERKLYKLGEVDRRIKALHLWLDYGFELGNHTFSHVSLSRVGLSAWEDDVIQGETVSRLLLAKRNMKLRYFRHPYLDVGPDVQSRRAAEAFLMARDYRIAPITIDPRDWTFNSIYQDAKQRGDTALEADTVRSYLSFCDSIFDYYEQLSIRVVGYEPKQILLLHANQLEAEHIGELIDLMRKRGYRFITLEDALSDPAYSLPDTYVGLESSWLEHWAITQGKSHQEVPREPQWVLDRQKPPLNFLECVQFFKATLGVTAGLLEKILRATTR